MYLQGENKAKAKKYLEAFWQAGENDPYLQKVAEEFNILRLKNQHMHGWGYILVTSNTIHHYANGEFFVEDTKWKKCLEEQLENLEGEFMLMIELRVTDEWYVWVFNSHPFHFMSRNGYEGYLFYNGLLDYEKLAEKEGIDFWNYKTKNGTTLMGISIARALESGKHMTEAIIEPRNTLKSAYNLMMFYRNSAWEYKANILAYIAEKYTENECVYRHNKLLKKDEWDLFFVGSSAMEIYAPNDYEVMKNGELLEFNINFIEEYYFDGYK